MARTELETFISENESLTAADRLRRAHHLLDYLMIKKMSVVSSSADGVSIQRSISEVREYIKVLQSEAANECAPFLIQRPTMEL